MCPAVGRQETNLLFLGWKVEFQLFLPKIILSHFLSCSVETLQAVEILFSPPHSALLWFHHSSSLQGLLAPSVAGNKSGFLISIYLCQQLGSGRAWREGVVEVDLKAAAPGGDVQGGLGMV